MSVISVTLHDDFPGFHTLFSFGVAIKIHLSRNYHHINKLGSCLSLKYGYEKLESFCV